MGTGGEGEVPPPASSQAGEQPAQCCCCPFIYWTRNTHISLPEEQASGMCLHGQPFTIGARAEDTGRSCHTSAAQPVPGTHLEPAMPGPRCLCVGQKLHPEPSPQQDICRGCRAQPTPHRAIPRPDLIFPPACPSCSFLSNVSFASFLAGGM